MKFTLNYLDDGDTMFVPNLDDFVDDGECKELTIKVIDAFEHEEVVPFVTKCLAKTSRGGTVSFHGKCLESLCGAVWL